MMVLLSFSLSAFRCAVLAVRRWYFAVDWINRVVTMVCATHKIDDKTVDDSEKALQDILAIWLNATFCSSGTFNNQNDFDSHFYYKDSLLSLTQFRCFLSANVLHVNGQNRLSNSSSIFVRTSFETKMNTTGWFSILYRTSHSVELHTLWELSTVRTSIFIFISIINACQN